MKKNKNPSILLYLFLYKADFIPASIFLDYHQRLYIYRILSLANTHSSKENLPISLRKGDREF